MVMGRYSWRCMVDATTSRRYQTVTRRSQLSLPMIDVAVSSEVTERSHLEVSSETPRLSAVDQHCRCCCCRHISSFPSSRRPLRRCFAKRNDNNRGTPARPTAITHTSGWPVKVGYVARGSSSSRTSFVRHVGTITCVVRG